MDADRVQPTYVGCPAAAPRAREARRVAAGVATAGVSRGRLREVASRPDSLPDLLVVRVVKAAVRLSMVEPGEDDADSWSAASRGCKVPGAPKGLLTLGTHLEARFKGRQQPDHAYLANTTQVLTEV